MKLGMAAALALALIACTPTTQQVKGVAAGVDFAVCVLGQYAMCSAAKTPWPQCTTQIVEACGGDAVTIAQVVDAHRAAEIREGYVLPPDAGH